MTQETDATSSAGKAGNETHREQEQVRLTSGGTQAQIPAETKEVSGVSKSGKAEKNLYEPYITPAWAWAIIRGLARALFGIFGRIRIVGVENLPPQGTYIVASNHLSWLDVPLIPTYMPRQVVYMAKEEMFESRVSWLVRFLGAFPVKRGEGDRQALRAADTQLKAGRVLVIFPEGTRSKTHTMNRAHAGLGMIALRSQAPVVPVAVSGSEKLFKEFRPVVTIRYGEPMLLQPKGKRATKEEIEEATDEVMRRIAGMLPEGYRGVYGGEQA